MSIQPPWQPPPPGPPPWGPPPWQPPQPDWEYLSILAEPADDCRHCGEEIYCDAPGEWIGRDDRRFCAGTDRPHEPLHPTQLDREMSA